MSRTKNQLDKPFVSVDDSYRFELIPRCYFEDIDRFVCVVDRRLNREISTRVVHSLITMSNLKHRSTTIEQLGDFCLLHPVFAWIWQDIKLSLRNFSTPWLDCSRRQLMDHSKSDIKTNFSKDCSIYSHLKMLEIEI